jgi:TPR repeat protein
MLPLRLFRLAAVNDDPAAESYLGMMLSKGQGVRQDDSEAASWLQRAAGQGNVTAQLNLGVAYMTSAGLRQDYVQAYKWFDIAAAKSDAQAVRLRTELAANMTASEIASAQALVKEWRPSPARGVRQ